MTAECFRILTECERVEGKHTLNKATAWASYGAVLGFIVSELIHTKRYREPEKDGGWKV